MFQPLRIGPTRWLLVTILLIYLILGTLYALYTPDWQAPDEPAHYNYVRYLAEQHRFPVLKTGDYPASYLDEIKAARFPPEMSISPIRYEFHQPPLYYVLAVPVYQLFGGALLPLRLLSVALGALLLFVVYWAISAFLPTLPGLALGATSVVAFLPMHLAVSASVNNDILAELLLATTLLFAIHYLKGTMTSPARQDNQILVLLGITTGLGLLTKSSAYVALVLVLAAIAARHFWLERPAPSLSNSIQAGAVYLLPAVGLALPWWLRNITLYGGIDFLGLGRHDQVVAGQLRTVDAIARLGPGQLVHDFVLTSFRSFWGQFGWMGVLLDERIYQALAILSGLAVLGLALWAILSWRRRAAIASWQWAVGGLLALSVLLTLLSYLWYNTQFVQHQGRYLFPALMPIGLAMSLGWREALSRKAALPLAALFFLAGAGLALAGVASKWPSFMLGVAAAGLVLRRLLPGKWEPLVQTIPFLLLVVVGLASLFLFIVPQLTI
jgi:hypothetical protein